MTSTLQCISIAQCMTYCFIKQYLLKFALHGKLHQVLHKNDYNHLFFIYIELTCFTHTYCTPINNSSKLILFLFNKREIPRLANITQAVKAMESELEPRSVRL